MSSFGRRTALAASLLALSPLAALAQTSGEPVNIGLVTSITGIGAGLGIPQRNGALLAEKDINAKGGIGGRPIKLIVEDDASSAETALSKANDLVHNKKVAALLGPTLTANTVAVGSLTDPMKFPQIAFTGLGPPVELTRKCAFHVSPPQVLITCPVIYELMSEARNKVVLATSSPLPKRPSGIFSINALLASSLPLR